MINDVKHITADACHRSFVCTTCGSTHLIREGVRPEQYADAPDCGKPTVVIVNRRRWRCQSCKAMLRDPLPDMDDNRPATKRLIEYVHGRCFSHTFAEISREVRINDKTVHAIFDEYVAELEASIRFETPRVLGIDEVKVIGKYRCILTNVEANAVFDFLPSRTMKELQGYFQQFPNRQDAEVFTVDLWNNYATVLARMPRSDPDDPLPEHAFLSEIVVREAARDAGAGQALMAAAENYAKSCGATEMRLTVWSENAGARRFYQRLGYADGMIQMHKPLS